MRKVYVVSWDSTSNNVSAKELSKDKLAHWIGNLFMKGSDVYIAYAFNELDAIAEAMNAKEQMLGK
jgi:hypothetical protein